MQELAKQIGKRAREARDALQLTQAEVAERVGIATEVYGRLERGKMMPSVGTLVHLVRVLGVTADQLLSSPYLSAQKEQAPELRRICSLLEGADEDTLRRAVTVVDALFPARRRHHRRAKSRKTRQPRS